MNFSKKFWVGVLAVVLFVAVPAVDIATLVLDDRASCLRIGEFVNANAAALPQTLDELSAYPVDYRRKIYGAVTPAVRSSLWREHLERFSSSRTLTAEQVSFVNWLDALLTPDNIANGTLKDYETEARANGIALFGQSAAADLMAVIGPKEATYRGVAALRIGVAEWIRSSSAVSAQFGTTDCTCSTQSDWCWGLPTGPSGGNCYHPDNGCIFSAWGCGFTWSYPCDGKCPG